MLVAREGGDVELEIREQPKRGERAVERHSSTSSGEERQVQGWVQLARVRDHMQTHSVIASSIPGLSCPVTRRWPVN